VTARPIASITTVRSDFEPRHGYKRRALERNVPESDVPDDVMRQATPPSDLDIIKSE
jgi:hypothetical protein